MNNKYKALLAAAMVSPMLLTTSCIEEVFPTSGVVQSQLDGNDKAIQALAWGMSSHLNQVGTVDDSQAYDWGYASVMHARDVMIDDMPIAYSGYDWFQAWSTANDALNEQYMVCQFTWLYMCEQVLTANNTIRAVPRGTTDPELMGLRGAGLAFRAATYLDMARMYEFLPNNYQPNTNSYGNDVRGLTVPIVTEETTEEQSRNNPRVTHEEMVKFILADLEEAVDLLKAGNPTASKLLPSLAVTYGLLARTYLWDATYHEMGYEHAGAGSASDLYKKAADYARLTITTSQATPTSQEEWLSTTNGFNDMSVSSWMWAMKYSAEDRAVTSALLNWVSWMSNETEFGYAIAGPYVQISKSLYDKISDRDFRKLSYVAPEGSPLSGRESYIDPAFAEENFSEYFSLKFRPGSGNMTDNSIACATAVPLMRVEEMYLLEAEAQAHINASEGVRLLNDFMQRYRYNTYRCTAASTDEAVTEIILQKRIELWGEGLLFFDYKRLNLDITRYYNGTNYDNARALYNTSGRPAWMNYVIVRSEGNTNKGVLEYNNPPCGAQMSPVGGE